MIPIRQTPLDRKPNCDRHRLVGALIQRHRYKSHPAQQTASPPRPRLFNDRKSASLHKLRKPIRPLEHGCIQAAANQSAEGTVG